MNALAALHSLRYTSQCDSRSSAFGPVLCIPHLSYQLPSEDLASTVRKDMLNSILVILCLIAVSAFFDIGNFTGSLT